MTTVLQLLPPHFDPTGAALLVSYSLLMLQLPQLKGKAASLNGVLEKKAERNNSLRIQQILGFIKWEFKDSLMITCVCVSLSPECHLHVIYTSLITISFALAFTA